MTDHVAFTIHQPNIAASCPLPCPSRATLHLRRSARVRAGREWAMSCAGSVGGAKAQTMARTRARSGGLFRAPGLVVAALDRTAHDEWTRRAHRPARCRSGFLMRLFPCFVGQWFVGWRFVHVWCSQPCQLGETRLASDSPFIDDPALLLVARLVEDIALIVFAHFHAVTPCEERLVFSVDVFHHVSKRSRNFMGHLFRSCLPAYAPAKGGNPDPCTRARRG